MKTSFAKRTALIVLPLVTIVVGAWLLMRSLGTGSIISAPAETGERKILYYKSTMMLGEISQTPRKDSMGMNMVPVYEGEEDSAAIKIDPVTMQNMGIPETRTASIREYWLKRDLVIAVRSKKGRKMEANRCRRKTYRNRSSILPNWRTSNY